MSRRPTWAAAPRPVSQSPSPQSHAALTRVGCCPSNCRTRSRSPWALPTNSLTRAGASGALSAICVLAAGAGSLQVYPVDLRRGAFEHAVLLRLAVAGGDALQRIPEHLVAALALVRRKI